MVDEKLVADWDAAFDNLRATRDHLKDQIGKPGARAAQMDHDKALDAYIKASEELPDA